MGGALWAPRYSSVRQFSRPHHVFVHRFRHHRRFAVVGLYPYAYGDGCYWLRRRALSTGSPYWWRRYYACRQGYYSYCVPIQASSRRSLAPTYTTAVTYALNRDTTVMRRQHRACDYRR